MCCTHVAPTRHLCTARPPLAVSTTCHCHCHSFTVNLSCLLTSQTRQSTAHCHTVIPTPDIPLIATFSAHLTHPCRVIVCVPFTYLFVMSRVSLFIACLPLVVLSLSSLLPLTSSLDNGLALTPPMGWSTWNVFECQFTEKELREMASALVSSGLAAAGYTSLNVDDCWMADERTANGELTYNTTKFPNGMKSFADHLHSLNLSLGLYSSSGPATCQGFPGSEGYEAQDAQTLAEWGVDFFKLDACYQFNISARQRSFTAMRDGLLATGRPIVFSCSTPELIAKVHNDEYPSEWGPSTCNMARIQWVRTHNHTTSSILPCIDTSSPSRSIDRPRLILALFPM